MSLRRTRILATVVLLAACGGLPHAPRPAQLYDLGPNQQAAAEGGLVAGVQVLAPSWLRSAAMQYRLSYASTSQRNAYVESRWAAPPAELIQALLSRSLAGGGACRLELELDEFIQDYPSAGHSDGVIEARARLRVDSAPTASQTFSLRVAVASADASGGVAALARGVRQLAGELDGWLGELGRDAGLREACARR